MRVLRDCEGGCRREGEGGEEENMNQYFIEKRATAHYYAIIDAEDEEEVRTGLEQGIFKLSPHPLKEEEWIFRVIKIAENDKQFKRKQIW